MQQPNRCGTDIQYASRLLRKGQLVAFPTETVYGLGGDATNETAIRKIFTAKGRPADHPLIVHLPDKSHLSKWASMISTYAWQLAEAFWPGPLTLILPKQPSVSVLLTGNQSSIGLRVPNHPMTLALLEDFGGGIAGPSANRFQHLSPTQSIHVLEDLAEQVDYVLEGGSCDIGIESTIVQIQDTVVSILRQGQITQPELEAVLKRPVIHDRLPSIRVPGTCKVHYAPSHPLYVLPTGSFLSHIQALLKQSETVGVLSFSDPVLQSPLLRWITLPNDPKTYAHYLYSALRELDKWGNHIVLESPPYDDEWAAIHERLSRAQTKINKINLT